MSLRPALVTAACGLLLTGCTGGEPTTPTPTDAPSEDPSARSTALEWHPVPGPVDDVVTTSGEWTLTVAGDGAAARLEGPQPRTVRAPAGFSVSDALVDGRYAVVVAEHDRGERPHRVTTLDLATGGEVDADVATGIGGAWALGSGLLVGTEAQGRDYCLVVTDLDAGSTSRGPCVPPRHGIAQLAVGPAGMSAMTFDDGRPSCRTLNRVEGGEFSPLPGVGECRGWDSLVSETFAIWGEVRDDRQVESGTYFLDAGSGPVELGPGTTGSLTWCGEAAYVVRDPQRGSDPAQLLRIDVEAATTEVVYATTATGRAFLSEPRCGGTDLTLTAYTDEGDEQVTARVG